LEETKEHTFPEEKQKRPEVNWGVQRRIMNTMAPEKKAGGETQLGAERGNVGILGRGGSKAVRP